MTLPTANELYSSGDSVDPLCEERLANTNMLASFDSLSDEELLVRLDRLDREWEIDRALEKHAGALTLIGLVLARTHSRRWCILSAAAAGALIQHAFTDWCPLIPLLQRGGFRSMLEIEEERHVLHMILRSRDAMPKDDEEFLSDSDYRAAMFTEALLW